MITLRLVMNFTFIFLFSYCSYFYFHIKGVILLLNCQMLWVVFSRFQTFCCDKESFHSLCLKAFMFGILESHFDLSLYWAVRIPCCQDKKVFHVVSIMFLLYVVVCFSSDIA